ncbi:MAG: N-acetylmuramoyl-L-alanine amidase [Bradyrhizobiaceae bacterium]|nr:MAG: N-acetylmuramoyl-L-alanine amidase [Bradyrhizobiaceae bacterium]
MSRAAAQELSSFEIAARSRGTPDIPGLNIVWITPWGDREDANLWHNIVVHQSEGPAGSALANAMAQALKPDKRGASIWVETDGTVYWATGEWATPSHVRSGNRNDDRYISNSDTYRLVPNNNSLGIEFVGNYPNVRVLPTQAQIGAWRMLVKVLQARYGIPTDRIFAHNWVDYKDRRYCEGCALASMARHGDDAVNVAANGPEKPGTPQIAKTDTVVKIELPEIEPVRIETAEIATAKIETSKIETSKIETRPTMDVAANAAIRTAAAEHALTTK